MKTTNSIKALVVAFVVIAAVFPAFAQEYMQVATNMPGFKPTMSYQNFGNGENVNGFNGGLTVSHSSSISLPQNLGASLGLSRVYNSKSVEDYFSTSLGYKGVKHGCLGAGWTLSMGRVFLRMSSYGSDPAKEYRKQWFYQDESGAEHRLYLNAEITGGIEHYDPSSQNQDVSNACPRNDKWYFTNDSSYIRAKYTADPTDQYDPSKGYWTIYFPDGSKKILGNFEDSTNAFVVPVIASHSVTNTFVDGWYTTRVIDRANNNPIKIYYNIYEPAPIPANQNDPYDPYDCLHPYAGAINHIIDQFNREITFYYKSDNNNKLNNLLDYIEYPDDSEEHFYYEVRSIPFPAQDLPFLIKVQDMAQLETLYDYKAVVSGFYLLYRIDYPTGATSVYDYESFSYQYRACNADTELCNDVISDTMTGVYLHKEFSAKDDGTQSDNIAIWKWDRADSADFWPGCINAQVILVPVLFTDPLGRKTVYFYAGEWGNNQIVPPGMEVGSIKYNSNGPTWVINDHPDTVTMLANAVYLSNKRISSNGGDADKCRGDHFVSDTTPPYVVGNIRVRKTIEAELDGNASNLDENTEHVLWKKL